MYLLKSIAAVVIGGTYIHGGRRNHLGRRDRERDRPGRWVGSGMDADNEVDLSDKELVTAAHPS